MNIDIREVNNDKVTSIQFANENDLQEAYILELDEDVSYITDGVKYLYIRNTDHAKNLIKALEKAIELKTWS